MNIYLDILNIVLEDTLYRSIIGEHECADVITALNYINKFAFDDVAAEHKDDVINAIVDEVLCMMNHDFITKLRDNSPATHEINCSTSMRIIGDTLSRESGDFIIVDVVTLSALQSLSISANDGIKFSSVQEDDITSLVGYLDKVPVYIDMYIGANIGIVGNSKTLETQVFVFNDIDFTAALK